MIALWAALALAEPLPPGRYALETVQPTVTRVPFFGRTRVTTTSTLIVDLVRDGDRLVQHQELCDVTIDGGTPLARTVIPDAFVAAMPSSSYPVDLTRDADGWRYFADPGPADVGWDPTVTDTLPDHADAPGVVDFECDGHPGATVQLVVPVFGRVDIYVAQHGWTEMEGRVDGDRVTGRVVVRRLAQRTLGASHRAFAADPPSEPEEGRFTLSPRDADATCADIDG